MWRLTLKNLRARKLRLITTSIAIALGVAFMAGSLVLTDTIGKTFNDLFASVYKSTDAVVRGQAPFEVNEAEGEEAPRPLIDQSLIAVVQNVPGVKLAEGSIQGYTQVVDKSGKVVGNPGGGAPTFGGIWSNSELNAFQLSEGRAPKADNEVVVDAGTAKNGKLAVGDEVTVLTAVAPEKVKIVGIARFGQVDSPAGAGYVSYTFATAQRLMSAPGKINQIEVVADSGVTQQEIRDRIAKVVPSNDEVVTGATITKEQQDTLKENLKFFNILLLVFSGIALIVGAFVINNTFSILVAQRLREMALLRAIGASRRQVLRSLLLESFIVGLVASLLGLVLGVGVAAGLRSLFGAFGLDLPPGNLIITPNTVIVSLLVGTVISVVSAAAPARKASKVPPIAAMRDVAFDTSHRSRSRIAIGILLAGAGVSTLLLGLFSDVGKGLYMVGGGALLTLFGVAALGPIIARPASRVIGFPLPRIKGMTGSLARENAMRNPKRTAATAAALMIGVALVTFITVFVDSAKASIDKTIDKSFGGDFVVQGPQTFLGGLSPALGQEIAALPEVKASSPLRGLQTEINGEPHFIVAIDPKPFEGIFDPVVTEGNLAALDTKQIAVQTDVAKSHGWKLGDEVPMKFQDGVSQQFKVVAIYKDSNVLNGYAIGLPAYNANVTTAFDYEVLVAKADNVSVDVARAAVEKAAAAYPTAKVLDQTQFKQMFKDQVNLLLAIFYVLLGLAVLIALLGIANTLALSIFERTRELGLLRAVGMTRRQLRSMVRWESVIIALFGTVLGLLVGVFFGTSLVKALNEEGITELVIPWGSVALIAVIAAAAGIVAAILPARRASRLDVLKAIVTT